MEFGLVGLWLVMFVGVGLLALPLAAYLFTDLEYAAFAIPLGLMIIGVIGHLVGHLVYGWPAVIAGLAILGASSYLAYRETIVAWKTYAEAVVVFGLGFLLVVAIRAVDPAAGPLPVAIGEKFIDFGLLRTLDRASTLPPEDMWFAGKAVQYHYGGHLLTNLLAILTGTHSRFAYNLGLAGFYGLLVSTAYGLASSIARPYGISGRRAGGLAAFLVGVAGNLEPAARVVLWILPERLARWSLGVVGLSPEYAAWSPGEFWYFDASRVMPIDPTQPERGLAATEFPMFAWLNGDLHAHMMSQPFVLLCAAALLAYWRLPDGSARRLLLLVGVLPPLVGLIGFMNLWSFPTVGGLIVLALVVAPGHPARSIDVVADAGWLEDVDAESPFAWQNILISLLATAGILILGILWTAPYWVGIVAEGPSQSLEYWSPWSPLGSLVLVHGLFVLVFGSYLALRIGPELHSPAITGLLAVGVFGMAVAVGAPAIGLFAPLFIGGLWLLYSEADAGFETVLILAGIGLVLLVEVVSIEGERFNVIFKYYVPVWLFWSVAAGVILSALVDGSPVEEIGVSQADVRRVGRGLVVVVVVLAGVYPAFAVPLHFSGDSVLAAPDSPTLDATAFLETEFPAEAPAIRWLDDREGQPVIVTAAPGGYRWIPQEGKGASAPASLTGLPTVLGWFHERQYRGEEAYGVRIREVEAIYMGEPANQRELLAKHDVQYIYVGPVERARYRAITIDEVEAVREVASWEGVRIYTVDHSAL